MFAFFGLPIQDSQKIDLFKQEARLVGHCHSVNVSSDGIGFGNLDSMLGSIERLKKLELQCE
jgi:hypothetical protein